MKPDRDIVLEAIPYDDWILASDIASNLGERTIDVAWVINNRLINTYVERKRLRYKQTTPYLYRRLLLISLPKKHKNKKISILRNS